MTVIVAQGWKQLLHACGKERKQPVKVFDTTESEKSKTKLWIEGEREREREKCVCVFECVFRMKNKGAEALH